MSVNFMWNENDYHRMYPLLLTYFKTHKVIVNNWIIYHHLQV